MAKKTLRLNSPLSQFAAIEGTPMMAIALPQLIVNPAEEELTFSAKLGDGSPLPEGLMCTPEGLFKGTPAKGTARKAYYLVFITVQGQKTPEPFVFDVNLHIYESKEALQREKIEELTAGLDQLEIDPDAENLSQYWTLFRDKLPLPDLQEILNREPSVEDIYYLLQRFATFTIWNGDDLETAEEGHLITLENASPKYNVYDFKAALVTVPKDLYSSEHTLTDGILTVKAMVYEARKREWNIELAGFNKFVTAAWIEVQSINTQTEKTMHIYNYQPDLLDYKTLEMVRSAFSKTIE